MACLTPLPSPPTKRLCYRANQSPLYQVHIWVGPLTRPGQPSSHREISNPGKFMIWPMKLRSFSIETQGNFTTSSQHEETFNELYYNKSISLGEHCVTMSYYFDRSVSLEWWYKNNLQKKFSPIYKKIFCIYMEATHSEKKPNSDSVG